MNRNKLLIGLVILAVLAAIGFGSFWWAIGRTPSFYRQAQTQTLDLKARKAESDDFVRNALELTEQVQHEDSWGAEFTDAQVNNWLAEEFAQKFSDALPDGITEPRVKFNDGRLLIGFRYQRDGWNSIVSIGARPWVPEPNQLAIQIDSIRAGMLPVPLEEILEELRQRVETGGWRTEWRMNDGADVVIVHLSGGKPDEPVLDAINVTAHKLRLSGHRKGTSSEIPTGREALNQTAERVSSGLR